MPTLTYPWALVVVVSGFFIQFFVFGLGLSIGLYNVEFLKDFDTTAAAVSGIGAINTGLLLGAGPFVNILVKRFGHRIVVMTGGIFSTVGLLFMMFAENIGTMYVLYGFITGLGFCMSYIPSHVLVGLYFKKYQSLATGVVTSGSGLGSTVMPVVINYLINEYSWKGSFLLVAGMIFQVVFLGALLRPPPLRKQSTEFSIEVTNDDEKLMSVTTIIKNNSQNSNLNVDEQVRQPNEKNSNNSSDKMHNSPLLGQHELSSCDQNEKDGRAEKLCLKRQRTCIEAFKVFCKQHFFVFTNFGFMMYFLSNICWNFSFGVFLSFAPTFFILHDLTEMDAALLLTILNFGSFIGCIVGGIVGNIKCFDRIHSYIIANIASCICLSIFNFLDTFIEFAINCVIFGLFFGVILGLLVIIIIDILDTELLSDGMAYIMFANGIGVFAGPPIAGYMFDVFHNFKGAFYMSSAILFIAGLIMFLIPLQKRCSAKNRSLCDENLKCELT